MDKIQILCQLAMHALREDERAGDMFASQRLAAGGVCTTVEVRLGVGVLYQSGRIDLRPRLVC
jgi:hypothetical protein